MKYIKTIENFNWDFIQDKTPDNFNFEYHINNDIPIKIYKKEYNLDKTITYINENIDWDTEEFIQEEEPYIPPLPKKWCIKVTPENKKILQSQKWGAWDKGYNFTINAYYSPYNGEWLKFETEISIEQFLNYLHINEQLRFNEPISENINWDTEEFIQEEYDDEIQVGDKVRFKRSDNNEIPKYYTELDGIPSKYIEHGKIIYLKNEAIVKHIIKSDDSKKNFDIYILKYEDHKHDFVQLGFKKDDFEKI